MGRGKAVRVIAAVVCAAVLVAVGARYFLLRDDRIETEQTVARLTLATSEALDVYRSVLGTRTDADAQNELTTAERDRVRVVAAGLHANLDRALADRTAAEIGAYISGAQANNLRACLVGVSQALNQLAVGDGRSIASLRAVEGPCRAVGIQ